MSIILLFPCLLWHDCCMSVFCCTDANSGQTVAVLFGAYAGEFAYAKANKIESGSKFINPNDIP